MFESDLPVGEVEIEYGTKFGETTVLSVTEDPGGQVFITVPYGI